MANSCGGADASVPGEIETAIKGYIRKKPNHRAFFGLMDEGNKYSCLLEDLGGARCKDGECCYNRDRKPTQVNESKKPI